MKEFLQGAWVVSRAGSNLTEYFPNKAEQYSLENRQNQKLFLDTLGLIAESYVTGHGGWTPLFNHLQSIMSILSARLSQYSCISSSTLSSRSASIDCDPYQSMTPES